MKKKTMAFVLAVLLLVSVFMLCACGGKPAESAASSSETTGDASSNKSEGAADKADDAQGIDGETVEIAVKNSSSEEGTLSALCPDSWHDHSGDEDLFFSESDKAGDYTKPYIKISYYDGDLSTGGSGEDVSFTLGGMSWEGLYDDSYGTYNVVTTLDEGKLSVISASVGPDDDLYKAVVESIKVSF